MSAAAVQPGPREDPARARGSARSCGAGDPGPRRQCPHRPVTALGPAPPLSAPRRRRKHRAEPQESSGWAPGPPHPRESGLPPSEPLPLFFRAHHPLGESWDPLLLQEPSGTYSRTRGGGGRVAPPPVRRGLPSPPFSSPCASCQAFDTLEIRGRSSVSHPTLTGTPPEGLPASPSPQASEVSPRPPSSHSG